MFVPLLNDFLILKHNALKEELLIIIKKPTTISYIIDKEIGTALTFKLNSSQL